MGFQQGLSGLNAASTQLDVIGNNVANANTYGFKSSRVDFGDMYANSFYGVQNTNPGIGVQTLGIAQQMAQGTIASTNNNLDLAVNNNGFFVCKASATGTGTGTLKYTRDGEFQVDNQGYINNNGNYLQGWPATATGTIPQGNLTSLQLQSSMIAPKASSTIAMGVNLNSGSTPPTQSPLDPTNPNTYNWSNSTTVYDSLGNAHNLTLYYAAAAPVTGVGTTWTVTPYMDGNATGQTGSLVYNTDGTLNPLTQTLAVSYTPAAATGSTVPINVTLNYTGSTQYAANSATNNLTNDGYASGTVSSINISSAGIIQASYTNGQTQTIGQVALANFTNDQGLQSLGSNFWQQTNSSGPPQYNAPGSGNAGTITASALENSNVDLTTELVNLITAQRYYQANSQTIKAEDTIMQTLVNLS